VRLGRLSLVAGLVAVVVGAGVAVLFATRGDGQTVARSGPAAAPKCSSRLLHDWSDGRIDGTYSIACYRTALRSLPADLEVYSSAHDDIAQALTERIVQSRHAQKISGHQGAASVRNVASATDTAPSRSSSIRPAR
jgi:hypothetical protein